MKLLIILIISYSLISCNNSSGSSKAMPDNSSGKPFYVIALVDTGTRGKAELRLDFVYRVIKDSLKYISVDESTQKRKLLKDTSYYVLFTAPILDSAGKKIQTISGGDSLKTNYILIPSHRILIDGGRIDSAMAKYKQR